MQDKREKTPKRSSLKRDGDVAFWFMQQRKSEFQRADHMVELPLHSMHSVTRNYEYLDYHQLFVHRCKTVVHRRDISLKRAIVSQFCSLSLSLTLSEKDNFARTRRT